MKDLSPELAAMLLASVIGGYTLIGGLGATFYVSYFNTALIFMLIIMLMVEVRTPFDLVSFCTNDHRCSITHSDTRTTRSETLSRSLSSLRAGRLPTLPWATREAHTSPSSAQVSLQMKFKPPIFAASILA